MAKELSGGDKLRDALSDLAKKVSTPGFLRVGFLEGATYADGTPVAYIASIQEFGARIEKEPGTVTIYRRVSKNGDLSQRFVKKSKSNFATDHDVGAHVINIPSRPFFRNMIKANKDSWPETLAKALKATGYSTEGALTRMGALMRAQLQQSITDLVDPALAPSTIRRKGSSKPLIETGHMYASVAFEVKGVDGA